MGIGDEKLAPAIDEIYKHIGQQKTRLLGGQGDLGKDPIIRDGDSDISFLSKQATEGGKRNSKHQNTSAK